MIDSKTTQSYSLIYYLCRLEKQINRKKNTFQIIVGIFGLIYKIYLGLMLVVTAIIMQPLIFINLKSSKGKKRAFKLFVFWSWLFRVLGLFGVKIISKSELPKAPFIIVANHISYLDIFLLYSILPQQPFLFLGKSEILKYPIFRTYFKGLNIPVYRSSRMKSARSIVESYRKIKDGWSLVIFPEGGIPDYNNPKMIPFKAGAFQIAKQAKIPIVPITFLNNHKLFSDPSDILGSARPGVSKLQIHPFISTDEVEELSIEELSGKCFEIINKPLKEMYPEMR